MAAGKIRPARIEDVAEIRRLIFDRATYELSPDSAIATEEQLAVALFGSTAQLPEGRALTPSGQPAVFCHVVPADAGDDRPLAGFAMWFLNYSTWLGTHGIYLEDLYVRPEYRGRKHGRDLLATLARLAEDRGYGRVEWWVLDWNEPALEFYRSIGAIPMTEWTVHRLAGTSLTALASPAQVLPLAPPEG
jgi:GNAT superfamily N-acetyltransferase